MALINWRKLLLFYFLLFLFLPFLFLFFWPSQKVYLIACDVGEGDALLITKGFVQVLIDGGPNDKVLNCLNQNMPFFDRTIELIINTHPDNDHLKGLINVLESYKVIQIVSNSQWLDTQVFHDFRSLVLQNKIPVYNPKKGEQIKIEDMVFKVLWPKTQIGNVSIWQTSGQVSAKSLSNFPNSHAIASQIGKLEDMVLGETKTQTNENSIVLHFQYYDFDALLTGDITAKQEQEIIKDYNFSDIEVLKIAHHGSKYSSCQSFLEAVKPKIAIISVGKNSWGHPSKEVLQRLENVGAKILRTDKEKIKFKISS